MTLSRARTALSFLFTCTVRLAQPVSFRAEVLEPVGSYCVHGPMPDAVEVEDGSG